jgi:hypothetical protein
MEPLFKILAYGAMLAASSTLAFASPLSGTVKIDGGQGAVTPILNSSTTSIVFGASDEQTFGGTLSFAGIPGEAVTFPATFTVPNTNGTPFAPEVLLTFTDLSATPEAFTVTSVRTAANGSLFFYGTLGSNPGNATLILTPDASENGSFSSTLTVSPTPEPSSLLLLGTGLLSAAGLMVRKRRAVTA